VPAPLSDTGSECVNVVRSTDVLVDGNRYVLDRG
jgi:hypothetical protein